MTKEKIISMLNRLRGTGSVGSDLWNRGWDRALKVAIEEVEIQDVQQDDELAAASRAVDDECPF